MFTFFDNLKRIRPNLPQYNLGNLGENEYMNSTRGLLNKSQGFNDEMVNSFKKSHSG